jgi:hypothetical protein
MVRPGIVHCNAGAQPHRWSQAQCCMSKHPPRSTCWCAPSTACLGLLMCMPLEVLMGCGSCKQHHSTGKCCGMERRCPDAPSVRPHRVAFRQACAHCWQCDTHMSHSGCTAIPGLHCSGIRMPPRNAYGRVLLLQGLVVEDAVCAALCRTAREAETCPRTTASADHPQANTRNIHCGTYLQTRAAVLRRWLWDGDSWCAPTR